MAYDEGLAVRVRATLQGRKDVVEKRMFGGLTFMVRGNMCCGIVDDDLMLRIDAEELAKTIGMPGVRPMDFTGRPMKNYIYVGSEGYQKEEALRAWIRRAEAFNQSLPDKAQAKTKRTSR
ncbi:MAG: TfoX/Sxy family protein [Chloroflexi bacterium]|nr:TfoX/Sxy family protein [Chloroflexota bacterium]